MSEAREDPKVVDYIQAGLDRANEASISRAAKIQVQLVLIQVQLVLILVQLALIQVQLVLILVQLVLILVQLVLIQVQLVLILVQLVLILVQLALILVQLVLILHTTKNRKERGEPGKIYHMRNVISRENLSTSGQMNELTHALWTEYTRFIAKALWLTEWD